MGITRRGFLVAGVALVGPVLAACGGAASPTAGAQGAGAKPPAAPAAAETKPAGSLPFAKPDAKPAAQAPARAGEVVVSFGSQGNKADFDMFDRIWDSHEKRSGGKVKVDRKYDPSLTWPKIINQLRTGTSADVMRTNDDDIFLLTSANVVASLDDRITKELKRDDYYPVLWQSRTGPGGELGSALVATAPYVMFYNVDLFQKAGVKAPTDWEKDNWTLDDLEAAMAKVSKKQGDRVDVYAWESDSYWWQVGLWNEGLPWYSEDETKAIWRTPEVKAALERYQRWYKEGWAVPPMGNKGQQIVQLFNSNLLAMVWRDTAFETSIKADVNWDVAPIPKGSKRDGCFHNDRNFTIPTASKVRDEAWQALKWLFTMDGEEGGQFEFAKIRWGVPVLKKAAEGPLFNDPKKKPKSIQVYFQGVQKAWPIPDNPMGEVFQVPWRRSDTMFTGQESVDKFLADSEELVDKVIKQVGWSKKMNARGYRLEGAIEKAGRLDEEEAATKPQAKPEAPAKKP